MGRPTIFLVLSLAVGLLITGASCYAAEYSFDGVKDTEYYPETSYEKVYGSKYNYGGPNLIDYKEAELPYGVISKTQIGAMEKVVHPKDRVKVFDDFYENSFFRISPSSFKAAYTESSKMLKADGSLGRITIPSLNISFKVRDGETNANMNKGFAHYKQTSGWNGNVGVCGHNRGTKYAIGNIKDLSYGDTITYSTIYGKRTYYVTTVKTIAYNDWSYLEPTGDNRLTITTCLKNRPELRVLVQARAFD